MRLGQVDEQQVQVSAGVRPPGAHAALLEADVVEPARVPVDVERSDRGLPIGVRDPAGRRGVVHAVHAVPAVRSPPQLAHAAILPPAPPNPKSTPSR